MHAQERLTAAEPLESAELERSARTDVDGAAEDGGEVDRASGELPLEASPVSVAAVVVGGCGGLRRGGRPTADEARRGGGGGVGSAAGEARLAVRARELVPTSVRVDAPVWAASNAPRAPSAGDARRDDPPTPRARSPPAAAASGGAGWDAEMARRGGLRGRRA
jgi:hypothetical protein